VAKATAIATAIATAKATEMHAVRAAQSRAEQSSAAQSRADRHVGCATVSGIVQQRRAEEQRVR
jgi:hypothetical protein